MKALYFKGKKPSKGIIPSAQDIIDSSHIQTPIKPILSRDAALKEAFKGVCEYCNGTGLIHDRELGWQTCRYCGGKK